MFVKKMMTMSIANPKEKDHPIQSAWCHPLDDRFLDDYGCGDGPYNDDEFVNHCCCGR